ncbi:MAG TPA: hypothetical protein EYO58_05695 [Flavobacteriales bacterium]|nr:hypothetical protein [Flavobacteriales bacterium]HIB77103.1 hypothetical protein [Flavobacteriales bacterium]
MSVATDNYTLTFSPPSKGWPSFYSYTPEWMQGMNQYFYSFYGGNLWRHNTNELRNNYYGTDYPSTVTSVFNQEPITNKLFKTLSLESDHAWGATFVSELQSTGFIEATYFEKKESDWFAFIRTQGVVNIDTAAEAAQEFPLRSANGIGNSLTATNVATVTTFTFPLELPLGNIPNIGDSIYYAVPVVFPAVLTPIYLGEITAINIDIPATPPLNNIVVEQNVVNGGVQPGVDVNYVMVTKNLVAESHGILGHYGVFTLTNEDTEAVELFAVKSEVMKSYP